MIESKKKFALLAYMKCLSSSKAQENKTSSRYVCLGCKSHKHCKCHMTTFFLRKISPPSIIFLSTVVHLLNRIINARKLAR